MYQKFNFLVLILVLLSIQQTKAQHVYKSGLFSYSINIPKGYRIRRANESLDENRKRTTSLVASDSVVNLNNSTYNVTDWNQVIVSAESLAMFPRMPTIDELNESSVKDLASSVAEGEIVNESKKVIDLNGLKALDIRCKTIAEEGKISNEYCIIMLIQNKNVFRIIATERSHVPASKAERSGNMEQGIECVHSFAFLAKKNSPTLPKSSSKQVLRSKQIRIR
ncbi:hypothetical protein [Hymenobacter sp. BRD67]|uniref:hypothetical protein n=1 Tax=Hymenobacter sp. BRD67 TaxID=2675877 RepID=UPI00156390D5|nr:hypothetical protein [Hymenobacter sp. BRD67]QKG52253.1 hypothetical protein GKZ67_06020 [Hymenobacter sp. BRD67]